MSKVYTGASMSLDGYVSGPDETGFEHLFKWYWQRRRRGADRQAGDDAADDAERRRVLAPA